MPVGLNTAKGTNRLLAALPADEYQRLTRDAVEVRLKLGEFLYEAKQPIHHVYFVLEGLGSVVITVEDGTTVEVMIVGQEGIVGTPAITSRVNTSPTSAFMQIEGSALKVDANVLREEFSRHAALHGMLLRYLQFTIVHTAQTAVCNRLHSLEERLSRWLLMVQDRVQSPNFTLNHEFLAQMLGTRRSSVTLAAGTLQTAGFLQYHRGSIHILNREGLEESTCECYRELQESWRLLD
jgi:CRP-like cAMP-binding protein